MDLVTKNYYFIIGVPRNATSQQIDEAYNKILISAGSAWDEYQASMTREAAEAYECLIDPARRSSYDAMFNMTAGASSKENIYHYTSKETSVAADIEFNKLRKKHNFKRHITKQICFAVIFICFAGAGLFYLPAFFQKSGHAPEIPAGLFDVRKEAPAPEPPAPEEALEETLAVVARKPVVREYQMKTGGVVIRNGAACRALPSESSPIKATMSKDDVVFATKETRYGDGNVWYYVTNNRFEGWASGVDIRVYKF
jgi:hypothetical protein